MERTRLIKGIKNVGDLIMYIGSAAITIPAINKAKENQNGFMGSCATGAGAMLSVGLGKAASNIFNKVVDKVADFVDDVTPEKKESKSEDAESNSAEATE